MRFSEKISRDIDCIIIMYTSKKFVYFVESKKVLDKLKKIVIMSVGYNMVTIASQIKFGRRLL